MSLLAWVQARDRNAVIVGACCGPLLGIALALLASPLEVDGPTSKATTLTREPRAVEVEPSATPSPPWESLNDVGPTPRTAVRVALDSAPPITVSRPRATPTPVSTPAPSPTPAAEDCVKGEDEHGGKGEPSPAEGAAEVEQTEPAEDETSPGTQEPPTSSTTKPPVKLCPPPPER